MLTETKKVIDNAYEIISIQAMTLLQAVDYLQCHQKMSPKTKAVYNALRNVFPKFVEDSPLYKDLAKIRTWLEANTPETVYG